MVKAVYTVMQTNEKLHFIPMKINIFMLSFTVVQSPSPAV